MERAHASSVNLRFCPSSSRGISLGGEFCLDQVRALRFTVSEANPSLIRAAESLLGFFVRTVVGGRMVDESTEESDMGPDALT